MDRLKENYFCRFMAKILVFLMVIQGMPLWELSQSYQWSPQKYVDLFTRVAAILSPAEAHAAAPVADAGSDKSLSKNQPVGSSIALDGSSSYDPDGDSLTCEWYGPFATTSGSSISKSISEGTYTVSLVVDDGTSRSDIDTAEITIEPCFNISVRAKSGKVQLTWTHLDGTERYDIYRVNESDPYTFVPIDSTTSTYSTYLDEPVANETTYLYVVGALSQGEWCYSNIISSHPTALRTRVPVNYAPVIYSSSIAHGTTGIIYNYDVNATDPNGDVLSYSLIEGPTGMTIDSATGLIHWTPADSQTGTFDVTARVQDTGSLFDTQSFSISVAFSGPVMVSVPDVVGQTQADAEAAILAANLTVGTITTANSASVPAGDVISQNPAGGTSVAQNFPVDLLISLGLVMVPVPDVVGMAQAAAEAAIVAANLTVGAIANANSDTVPAGNVISHDPAGGTSVADGSPIDMVISLGPVMVTVPDVVGQAQADAEAAILAASLVVGTVTTATSGTVPSGSVISQDPIGGTSVPEGSAVDFVVSLGPVMVSVPDVVGMAQAAAEAAIVAANLTVGIITTADSATVPAGDVISQDPVGGSSVAEASSVDLVVSLGPVMVSVPDIVGQTQANAEAAIIAAILVVGTVTTANSATVPAGDVISQDPAAGASVVIGTAVNLIVSLGQQMVTVPDVMGMAQAAAEAAIIAANLSVGNITTQNSATVPAGNVITQNPIAGASVVQSSAVDLVVSLGPVMATVPDVVGQLQANAEAAVLAAGLVVGAITTANSDTVPAGNVISQDPFGGSSVVEGSAVDLVISLGPAVIDDYTRPEVSVTIVPTVANVGESVTITVNAADNASVVSQELLVNGVSISLDVSGTATYSSDVAGVFTAVATALDASGNEGLDSKEFRFLTPGDTTPPTVTLSSPVDEAKLSVPTDIIGTAGDDTNLTRYKLEYSVKDKNEFITFASGTSPVTNDVLGQLDPTMMRNGLYDVRLTAEDASGNTASITRTYQLEGEMKVGNFTISFNDLTIPVAGMPITITRSYDSRVKTKGDFGVGWTMDLKTVEVQENRIPGEGWELYCTSSIFGLCLTYGVRPTESHTVLVSFPDGRNHEFNVQAVTSFALASWVQGHLTFAAQSGTFSTLQALDNTTYDFLMGNELLDFGFDIINPDRYQLTDVDSTVFVCNQSTGLEQITDPNGNTITFTAGGIIHSAGKSVTFTRDAHGRITAITDPMGNTIHFVYDFYGDLVSVTDQEGNTTEFTYNSSHGLVDIIDPRGIRPARNEYDDEGKLVAIIDADGNRVEFTHNVGTRQEVVKDRSGNVTVYEYDDDGNVVSQTDTLGNTTDYTYDDRGNKLTETDPLGNTTSHTYDTRDNMLSQTDPLGNMTTYTYNSRNQVLTTTDPNGNATTNTYDASGNLLTTTDSLGNVTTNSYDTSGNLLSTTDCLGNVTTYEYDTYGNLIKQTDPLGNVATYTYDGNGNQLTQTTTRTTDTGPVTMTTTNEYDGLNRLIKTTDPDGNVTSIEYNSIGKQSATVDKNGNHITYEYDLMGNLIKTTYPDGTTETATYDANGNKLASTDRGGRSAQYEYDPLNRLIMTTFPDGSSTSSEYDDGGKVIATIDENGNRTSYEYDAAGRRTSLTDALGNVTTFTYNGNGNQISMTDANSNAYFYQYDALNRRIKTTFPDGTFIAIGYDCLGRKISETDQAGIITQFEYDALGRLTKVIDALGGETTYTYGEVGNKVTQTDPNGHTTRWAYDNLGRIVKHTLPLGMFETFTYDANGNMVTKLDFNGDTINYTYDVNNRFANKTYPDFTQVSFTYRDSGQRETVTDVRGETSYDYDSRDRLIEQVNPDSSTLTYTYDLAGNRTSVTIPSGTTTYTYDVLNRLETVTDPDAGVTTYTYGNVGNRASVTYPNGTTASYTYDTLNRLMYLENKKSTGEIISSYTYTLGPVGNRTRVVEDSGRTVDYTYDNLYRLTQEDITDPVLGNETISYIYDAFGNRLTKTDSTGATNYTYDANDRLLTEAAPTHVNTYTYDNNGNTTSKSDGTTTSTYTYDYENRLVAAQTGSSQTSYEYDADGIRAKSTSDGAVTHYLVDKNRPYAQVLEETDGSGFLIVSYIYGDDLISQKRGGLLTYYHYDGQMSSRKLSDTAEVITDTYVYDAFGILLNRTGATVNNYLYTGEQYDPNIGFYYLRARYYIAEVGRFLTVDLHMGNIYDPPSLHKYLYSRNNPANYIDPGGEYFGLISLVIRSAIQKILYGIRLVQVVGFMIMMKVRIIAVHFARFANNLRISNITGWSRYNTLLQQAISRYGHRGAQHMHHVVPQYIVRALRAANVHVPNFIANWRVPLHPRYHQLITNAIRQAYPFGQAVFQNHPASVWRLLKELLIIYYRFPLP